MNMYFPEDPVEYIPNFLLLLVFVIVAIYAMRIIKKVSAKELEKAKKLEAEIMKQHADHKQEEL